MLWLLAIVFFYLPLAAVVTKLSRAIPIEGGVYQWVKEGLSPFAGYMAGWSLTVTAVCFFASVGSMLANGFAYAGGVPGSWMAASKPFALTLTALACLITFAMNVRGLHAAKWLSGVGSLLMITTFRMLLYLLMRAWATGTPSSRGSLSLVWPGFSILTLNVFTKMALGALSGFDNSAVFSEECRKPENDVARPVLIAAPLIAFIYILGTLAVLAYVPPAAVDLAATVPQVLQAGCGVTTLGRALTSIAVYGFNVYLTAAMVIFVGMVARLPMVAGWYGLLPAWWSQLHPKFQTPYKAIAAVTATLLLLGVLSLLGAANQEAVQLSSAISIGSLCIMYMLLFSVILFGLRQGPERPGIAIRLGALAAFLVAFASLIFEILPLGDVASPALFALKVGGTICAANGLGAFLYWRGVHRLRRNGCFRVARHPPGIRQ